MLLPHPVLVPRVLYEYTRVHYTVTDPIPDGVITDPCEMEAGMMVATWPGDGDPSPFWIAKIQYHEVTETQCNVTLWWFEKDSKVKTKDVYKQGKLETIPMVGQQLILAFQALDKGQVPADVKVFLLRRIEQIKAASDSAGVGQAGQV